MGEDGGWAGRGWEVQVELGPVGRVREEGRKGSEERVEGCLLGSCESCQRVTWRSEWAGRDLVWYDIDEQDIDIGYVYAPALFNVPASSFTISTEVRLTGEADATMGICGVR